MTEFHMPSLGADMEAGTLVEWRKKPGDSISKGDIIAEVDTQKGLIEIEIFEDGILDRYMVSEGQKIPVGTVMALIRSAGEPENQDEETKQSIHPIMEQTTVSGHYDSPAAEKEKDRESPQALTPPKRIKASPLAREIAKVNQVDLSMLKGSGEEGAILRRDVEKVLEDQEKMKEEKKEKQEKQAIPPITPPVTNASQVRNAVAAAMARSNRDIPHYYLEKRIDLSAAMEWIKNTNLARPVEERILPVTLFIRATALALDANPSLNAIWDQGVQLQNEINVGLVVSLRSGGVIVPSIQQADTLSVDQIMNILNDIIPRARALKLKSSELGSSTITLTSLGEAGADTVYGVIYPPQVALIGFGRVMEDIIPVRGMLAIRPVVHVTLAGDHRASDGLTGSHFLSSLDQFLQKPENL